MDLGVVWRHGAQCWGIDSGPGESCSWQASWRIMCPSRGGFESSSANLLFDCCPYTDSRVRLMEDWRLHSGRRGDVLSTWVPTVRGMTPQCPRWRYSGGDGRTGPEVMEETCFAGLTSRCRPRWVWSWWSYPFRWCRHPLSRGAMWRRYGSRRHNVTE
jgi:hypothetical protein